MTAHTICIYERPPEVKRPRAKLDRAEPSRTPVQSNPADQCTVQIVSNRDPNPRTRVLVDPFSRFPGENRHPRLARFLEEGLGATYFNHVEANEIEEWIHDYRVNLFDALGLTDERFDSSYVEINIFPYLDPKRKSWGPGSSRSILAFYWELLEFILDHDDARETSLGGGARRGRRLRIPKKRDVWPLPVQRVCVRRVVSTKLNASGIQQHQVPQRVPWSKLAQPNAEALDECRVLLVIARRFGSSEYEISPSFIKKELLSLFEDLNRQAGREFYRLEVVRPGSFEELRNHLRDRVQRPIHMVHFDMHGIVKCLECDNPRSMWRDPDFDPNLCKQDTPAHRGSAFLQFATIDEHGHLATPLDQSASDIAELLKTNNIHCVALNACESARTDDGDHSNLSYTFLQHDISNIVAMSFWASDAMFAAYFKSFYHTLFQVKQGSDFAQAASDARQKLQESRGRESVYDDEVLVDDWFVPVTYCNENVVAMPCPEGILEIPSDINHETAVFQLYNLTTTPKVLGLIVITWGWILALSICGTQVRKLVLCVFLLLTSTIGFMYLWMLSEAVLSLRSFKVVKAREIACKVLDNNMLSVEAELKTHQPVVLHGLQKTSDPLTLIDNLSFVWNRTHFIDLITVIPAIWFYQPELVQKMRRWCCGLVHRKYRWFGERIECCFGEQLQARRRCPLQRQMVVITDLEKLFPQEPQQELGFFLAFLQRRAQKRFKKFLKKEFTNHRSDETNEVSDGDSDDDDPIQVSAGIANPFLFLSGGPTLQDPLVLNTSLENSLSISGIRSTLFSPPADHSDRTGSIERRISRV